MTRETPHQHWVRRVALLVVLVVMAAACSGTPTGDDDSDPGVTFGDPDGPPGGVGDTETSAPTDGDVAADGEAAPDGDPDEEGAPDTSGQASSEGAPGDPAPAPPGGDGGGTAPAPSGGSGGSTPAPSGGGSTPQPEVALYSGAANTQGMTDDSLSMCAHAALVFAEAFDVRAEDLSLYWDIVNEAGGVHGREVTVRWEDDAYSPDQAIQAAEACRSRNPFLMLGGIGFDQIPAVRQWAEANKMLYFHHIAIEPDRAYQYSFTAQPTVERTGKAFGEYIGASHGDKSIGILYRASENWEPGRTAGKAELERRGADIVADLPLQQNQGVYSQQILELQRQGAEVVWVWENALAAAQIIQQAAAQRYRPKWVVFPFQTTLDVIRGNALNPTIDGVATWPAYAPGGYGDAFAEHGLTAEILRFEAAYREHRPRTNPNDILWQVWIGNKFLHEVLDRCGRDCTRNRFAGVFASGLKLTINPGCAVDFSRPASFNGRHGGFNFLVQETFQHSSGPQWKNNTWCTERLG